MSYTYDKVQIAGEDIDLLVILCSLSGDVGDHNLSSNILKNNLKNLRAKNLKYHLRV